MAERSIWARPGLQAERTDLSWTRTSLSFAVNGSLLLVRADVSGPGWLHYSAAALAGALLLFALGMAHRRRRMLEQRPLPVPLADPYALGFLTLGALALGLMTLLILLLG